MPLLLVTIGGHLVVWRAKHCHDGCVHRYIPTYNSAAAADNRCTSGSHQPVVIERCHRSPDLIDWLIGEPRRQMMAISARCRLTVTLHDCVVSLWYVQFSLNSVSTDYRAMLCVCCREVSVRLSATIRRYTGIVSKRLKISSKFSHHLIAHHSSFLRLNSVPKLWRDLP